MRIRHSTSGRTTPRRRRSVHAIVITSLMATVLVAAPGPAVAACGTPGSVVFPTTQVTSYSGPASDKGSVVKAIVKLWQRYLAMDAPGFGATLAPDVVKMSGRWGAAGVQRGSAAVIEGLGTEWSAFEHPTGVIAEAFTIKEAEVWSDGARATAFYWVAVRGGARWCYTDQGLVMQSFAKINGTWRLTFQTDAWNLSYNISKDKPGKETFPFDWVTPVNDMDAQVAFYERFAGTPEYVTPDRASFQLKGAHFILDRTGLNGVAEVRVGKPNGYAIFPVDDVVAVRSRLVSAGVRFVAGTGTTFLRQGNDRYAIALDPSGNPFVIMERTFNAASAPAPQGVVGLGDSDPRVQTAKRIADAWLRMDATTLKSMYGTSGRLFDDTRTKVRGPEKGSTFPTVLPSAYWSGYDRSSAGLAARMTATEISTVSLGARNIVGYQMELVGLGAHPYRDTAFVTTLLSGTNKPLITMVVGAEEHTGLALSLDYSGYPVTDLAGAEAFYRDTMDLGTPYPDSGYRGWWADSGVVFGIYVAKPTRDGLPVSGEANGYMSFWISSAEQTYDVLKRELGATFPLIPAINSHRGIDPQPGYTQVVATDPDGNVQVFTEYTGE